MTADRGVQSGDLAGSSLAGVSTTRWILKLVPLWGT
jgi:hypothetical protein